MVIFLYLCVGAIAFGVFVRHGEPLVTAALIGLLWLPWAIGVISVIAIDEIRGKGNDRARERRGRKGIREVPS